MVEDTDESRIRGLTPAWTREAKQWSLAVDGELLIEGVPLDRHSFPGEVVFYGDENTTIYVDALQASAETFHQFGDERVSGEDNETGNSGTRTAASDPNLAKITGESTIEPQGGHALRGAPAAGVLDIVYVDNGVGDDAFDGAAAAIESPGRGPVASLGAALARVRDGGTIVVYKGAFVYSDNLGALNGRSINIRTVGNVRVRSEG